MSQQTLQGPRVVLDFHYYCCITADYRYQYCITVDGILLLGVRPTNRNESYDRPKYGKKSSSPEVATLHVLP